MDLLDSNQSGPRPFHVRTSETTSRRYEKVRVIFHVRNRLPGPNSNGVKRIKRRSLFLATSLYRLTIGSRGNVVSEKIYRTSWFYLRKRDRDYNPWYFRWTCLAWVFDVSLSMQAMTKFFRPVGSWSRYAADGVPCVLVLNHRGSIPGMLHSSRSNVSDAETEGLAESTNLLAEGTLFWPHSHRD